MGLMGALFSTIGFLLSKRYSSDIASKIWIVHNILWIRRQNILFRKTEKSLRVQFAGPNGTFQDFVQLLKNCFGQFVWIEKND